MKDNDLKDGHTKFLRDEKAIMIHNEKLFQFMKHLLDGQRFYIGRDLFEVHENLGIKSESFDKMSNLLKQVLARLKPRPKMHVFKEIMNRVSNLREKIVIPPKEETKS